MTSEQRLKHLAEVATQRYSLHVWQWLPGPVGQHAPGSLHYQTFPDGVGKAWDCYGPLWRMLRFRRYLRKHHPYLTEGIWNGPFRLSVENGKVVPPSFWGAQTWAAHRNHLHLGIK